MFLSSTCWRRLKLRRQQAGLYNLRYCECSGVAPAQTPFAISRNMRNKNPFSTLTRGQPPNTPRQRRCCTPPASGAGPVPGTRHAGTLRAVAHKAGQDPDRTAPADPGQRLFPGGPTGRYRCLRFRRTSARPPAHPPTLPGSLRWRRRRRTQRRARRRQYHARTRPMPTFRRWSTAVGRPAARARATRPNATAPAERACDFPARVLTPRRRSMLPR